MVLFRLHVCLQERERVSAIWRVSGWMFAKTHSQSLLELYHTALLSDGWGQDSPWKLCLCVYLRSSAFGKQNGKSNLYILALIGFKSRFIYPADGGMHLLIFYCCAKKEPRPSDGRGLAVKWSKWDTNSRRCVALTVIVHLDASLAFCLFSRRKSTLGIVFGDDRWRPNCMSPLGRLSEELIEYYRIQFKSCQDPIKAGIFKQKKEATLGSGLEFAVKASYSLPVGS